MTLEEIKNRAEERMPDNAAEIVSSCETAFREYLLIGVLDETTGAMFVHGDVKTERIATFVATLCKQDPSFLPRVFLKLQTQKMNVASAAHLMKPDVLSDQIIFRDGDK